MALMRTGEFVCKWSDPLSYLYLEGNECHLIRASSQGTLRTKQTWLNFQLHPQPQDLEILEKAHLEHWDARKYRVA